FVSLPKFHAVDSDPSRGVFPSQSDQGPDDFIVRNGIEAFKALVDAAVTADPLARVACTIAGASSSQVRSEGVAHLLGELPIQAMLHEGGALLIDQVGVGMKIAGIGKRAVHQAVKSFAERLSKRATSEDPEWKSALSRNGLGAIETTIDNVLT